MFLSALLLFLLFLALSAFFSSSETAFVASNPYTLESMENKGSKKARLVREVLGRIDGFLATILIGNTLVNAAAASVATYVFVILVPNKNQAVLLATLTTTILLLFFAEINPKTFAAHNPVKTSFLFVIPIRILMVAFSPLVRVFSFLSGLLFPSTRGRSERITGGLGEEEVRVLLSAGVAGLSLPRRKMISGILDIGSRPVKEVLVPRPQVKAIEVESTFDQVLEAIRSAGFSRYPVYRGRPDNVEGLLHAKDLIPFIMDHKDFSVRSALRTPFFVPESASMEKVMLQMQENAVHMAFVVDEFGNMEGIVTLEDIIEEIVGDIRDEHDDKFEEWYTQPAEGVFIIKGSSAVKEINEKLPLRLPEKNDYTTLAGFFLYEFGRIPQEKESFEFEGHRFIVEKMNKRHIGLIKVVSGKGREGPPA
jgi:putative hemolysin